MTENGDTHRDRPPPTEIAQGGDGLPDQAGDDRSRRESSFPERETPAGSQPVHDGESDDTGWLRVGKKDDNLDSSMDATDVYEGFQPREHISAIHNLPHSVETGHPPELSIVKDQEEASERERDRELADLRYEVQGLRAAKSEWEKRFHGATSELHAAQHHIAHMSRLLEEAHHQCEEGDNELRKLRALLEDRTEEVKVAQAFMTTADKYSVAEVSQMVEQLNDEIYQCAMALSDVVLDHDVKPSRQRLEDGWKERLEEAHHTLRRWNQAVIARLEVDLLRDDPDTTLLECMVQYVFTTRCREIIRAFCPQDKVVDNYLSDLWEEIAGSHETAIARNWLAITRATTKVQGQPLNRHSILRQLGALLTLSGREPPTSTWLEDFMGLKLDEMAAKAAKVKEALAEGVLSVDVEIFAHGRDVDFNPAEMRDAYEKPGRSRSDGGARSHGGKIVCATGLGIRRITRERGGSDPVSMLRKREIVLKTKVLIYSTLVE